MSTARCGFKPHSSNATYAHPTGLPDFRLASFCPGRQRHQKIPPFNKSPSLPSSMPPEARAASPLTTLREKMACTNGLCGSITKGLSLGTWVSQSAGLSVAGGEGSRVTRVCTAAFVEAPAANLCHQLLNTGQVSPRLERFLTHVAHGLGYQHAQHQVVQFDELYLTPIRRQICVRYI